MNTEQDLINRLMISKKIMDRHNEIGRGQTQPQTPTLEEFQPVNANYNLPKEFLEEAPQKTYNTEIPTQDRILKSKLPDEIKQLMIEHPIQQPTMGVATGVGLSEESTICSVARGGRVDSSGLGGGGSLGGGDQPKKQIKKQVTENKKTQNISNDDIRDIIRETVEDVLRENGLIAESETKSNEVFKFRVGQHLFEGRVTNIKKIPRK
ncbi:MAG: hypothetical protein ACO3GZ_03720 [Ilumatobacteraceae bacterium]